MKTISGLTCLCVLNAACSSPVSVPPIEKVLPADPGMLRQASDVSRAVDFNLDGTLSMQGFARPGDGRFSQLLQDLNLSFAALWKPGQITYNRFGSVIEPISQRPFYVAASSAQFFKGSKEYATTRIDKVFGASQPGHLSIVMTDLFEQDLDISSIQQSLKGASFPEHASLAIWQWSMPFDGPIFDFDFRIRDGRTYAGNRYLYMLALGANKSILDLRAAIDRSVTVGKPQFLLLSNEPSKAGGEWLAVTQTKNAALKSRSSGAAGAIPYSVYRVSRGCDSAEITARAQLTPRSAGVPELSTPGTYNASLFALTNNKTSWSSRGVTDPDLQSSMDRSGHELLHIQVKCGDVAGPGLTLMSLRRVGTGNDLVLPEWVTGSSATSMQFNDGVKQKRPDWGQKTLNLLPFVRGLASTATERSTLAIAYMYLTPS